jgi:hypothetical protein
MIAGINRLEYQNGYANATHKQASINLGKKNQVHPLQH